MQKMQVVLHPKGQTMKLSDTERFQAALRLCIAAGDMSERTRRVSLKFVDNLWSDVQGNTHLEQKEQS